VRAERRKAYGVRWPWAKIRAARHHPVRRREMKANMQKRARIPCFYFE